MTFILLIFAIILFSFGVFLLLSISRQKKKLAFPNGINIYKDFPNAQGLPAKLLYSKTINLCGKPDYVFKNGSEIIPLEIKSGATPNYPYKGHILQLIAYCYLVEENYDIKPKYGIINYPSKQFIINYTDEYISILKQVVKNLSNYKNNNTELHRNHKNENICKHCGYYTICNEK